MRWITLCTILPLLVVAATGRTDEKSDAEIARLRARVNLLETENRELRAEARQLKEKQARMPGDKQEQERQPNDVSLLWYIQKAFDENPADLRIRTDLAAMAKRLAPQMPGHPLVWQALVKSGALKEGMSFDEAQKLLGKPTDQSETGVGWYYNPRNMHVAPYLHATVTPQGLTRWAITSR